VKFSRNLLRSLLAILLGNALYFALVRFLPSYTSHQAFQIDFGLVLDFGLCVAAYGIIRRLVRF
jgi:hypothetical protein